MNPEVKPSVDARINMFQQYLDVPAGMQPQVDAFVKKITELGEQSASAAAFEAEFAASGLSDEFNSIIPQCVPKAVPVSQEWQDEAAATRKEMMKEFRKDLMQHEIESAGEMAEQTLKDGAIRTKREAMIASGTFDEYTRISNTVEDAQIAGGFLKKMFRKKGKKEDDR